MRVIGAKKGVKFAKILENFGKLWKNRVKSGRFIGKNGAILAAVL